MSEEKILTKEGRDKLQAEYDNLTTVRRKEVAEHLKEARSYGDLSENAEYDAAKDEQAAVEMRIQELEEILRNAKVVDNRGRKKNRIDVGTEITVEYINLHGKKVKKDYYIKDHKQGTEKMLEELLNNNFIINIDSKLRNLFSNI